MGYGGSDASVRTGVLALWNTSGQEETAIPPQLDTSKSCNEAAWFCNSEKLLLISGP